MVQENQQRPSLTAAASEGSFSDLSKVPKSRAEGMEEKRVSNRKLKQELLQQLRYPSYREGMQALVRGDKHPFSASDLQVT